MISIHALREEGDDGAVLELGAQVISIHALREEGDFPVPGPPWWMLDFNPRPPRGGRHATAAAKRAGYSISIHALREEGDVGHREAQVDKELFQSTPSARRATSSRRHIHKSCFYFNPRPPRGGRLAFEFEVLL